MKYIRLDGSMIPQWPGYWDASFCILALLMQNDVSGIWWLDADTLIVGDDDMRRAVDAGHIAMSRPELPTEHWNCGVFFLRNCERARAFVRATIERGPGGPPWHQQRIMNDLLTTPEWGGLIQRLPDKWNSIVGYAEVDDPQIVAWHGTLPNQKMAIMQEYMKDNGL